MRIARNRLKFASEQERADHKRSYDRQRSARAPVKAARRAGSKFDTLTFIAIDGEGWDVGPTLTTGEVQDGLWEGTPKYQWREHVYTLLAAYDGETHKEYHENGERLGTRGCLDFLLSLTADAPNSALVCYGASYDINQIFRGLSFADAQRLAQSHSQKHLFLEYGDQTYEIAYQPRKRLVVRRYTGKVYTWKGKVRTKQKPNAKFVLWDVIGFFQTTFTSCMKDWLGKDHAAFREIERMKALRNTFTLDQFDQIKQYNRLENEALVQIMERLRAAMKHPDVSLKLTRWDGAGAVAAAMFAAHDIKSAMCDTEALHPAVFEAALGAYSGGHIESMVIGYQEAPIWHYDVVSAYPSIIRDLPDLSDGQWSHGTGEPPPGITVIRSQWAWPDGRGQPFYPLFWRAENGAILYPRHGQGWHWHCEWQVAAEYVWNNPGAQLDVLEWWHFEPASGNRPFAWVQTYFDGRHRLKAADPGNKGGPQYVLKLGLNSLYGKTVQQVGYRIEGKEVVKPPYFQMEWAGLITAGCRAMLMRAALQSPASMISFATDGIFSLAPLDIELGTGLGQWECSQHEAMFIVMPGYYEYKDAGAKWSSYSRGFNKGEKRDLDDYLDCWKKRIPQVAVNQRRLIGLKQASVGNSPGALWPMRGCWVTSPRVLDLTGRNSKRHAMPAGSKPWQGFVLTKPRDTWDLPGSKKAGAFPMSRPHDLEWKSKVDPEEWEGDNWEEE